MTGKGPLGWIIFILLVCASHYTHPDDELPIFDAPPDPKVLVDILYAPRYRSVDVPQTEAFGMTVHFDLDSSELQDRSLPMLDSVAAMLALPEARGELLVIEGHTDATGSHAYNQSLSVRRARAIKQYLVTTHGVAADRLVTLGFGEERLHDGDNPGADINRRAEFRSLDGVEIQ